MSLLSATDLSKSFGSVDIFRGVSLSIPHGARIAIVGPNGIGKTTLLRILLGLDEPSSGSVQRARGASIGYLPQEAQLQGTHTVWEECLAALQSLVDPEEVLELDGLSDSDWRERIGNAVPPAAAEAIASTMFHTLLLAWSGETFLLSSTPIWVRPMAWSTE